MERLPSALANLEQIRELIGERRPVFFLDLDGTLAPLVPRPELVQLPEKTKQVLSSLARDHEVCVVSGRDLADLRLRVGLAAVHYVADHGHRVLGRAGSHIELEVAPEDRLELERTSYELETRLRDIPGVVVEPKGASISIHYRLVPADERERVQQIVTEADESAASLVLTEGKEVHELRPRIPWDKGRAMLWLLAQLRLQRDDAFPMCLGDDLTDEDMFRAARGWGVGIIVGEPSRATAARYMLVDPGQAAGFLEAFVTCPDKTFSLPV